jgi:hypothetical protein
MNEQDEQNGPLLSRRETMVMLGTVGAVWPFVSSDPNKPKAPISSMNDCIVRIFAPIRPTGEPRQAPS